MVENGRTMSSMSAELSTFIAAEHAQELIARYTSAWFACVFCNCNKCSNVVRGIVPFLTAADCISTSLLRSDHSKSNKRNRRLHRLLQQAKQAQQQQVKKRRRKKKRTQRKRQKRTQPTQPLLRRHGLKAKSSTFEDHLPRRQRHW